MIAVSVVVPVYSGAEHLPELIESLSAERAEWESDQAPYRLVEAIFVDDASVDESSAVLEELGATYDWIRVVTLARNFGQHPATIAGILHTSGDWVVTLDEDMQHDPVHIESLLEEVARSGADVVYARPEGSVHRGYRDFASRGYKRVLVALTGNRMIPSFNSYRLVRGPIARAAASVSGHETYYDIAIGWFTHRFESAPLPLVDARHQQGGRSGYSFRKLISHARRLIVSSHTKVMRGAAVIGILAVAVAFVFAIRAIVNQAVDTSDVKGWTSLFVGILFFGGIVSLLLVVILEYLMNVVLHLQGKPTFFAVDRSSDRVLAAWFESRHAAPEP